MVAFETLVNQLDSEDVGYIVKAAHALGDLGDRRAVPILIRLLQSTERHRVKNAAAVGLRELADPVALEPILEEIRDPRNANFTGTLIWALETLNARTAVVDLAHIVCQDEYEAAMMAIGAMQGFVGPLDTWKRTQALSELNECVKREHSDDWRVEMVSSAIELLEGYESPG